MALFWSSSLTFVNARVVLPEGRLARTLRIRGSRVDGVDVAPDKGDAVVDLAMSTVGGSAYFKTSPLEQAYRDVRAGLFHPLNPERTLTYAGRLALGLPADTVW